MLRVFGKASAHETERRRDGVLTESRGIASRASPPRAGASPRRAGGTRAVDRGVVRSVARVPLLDRDTASAEAGPRARRGRDRSSHGPRRASIMSFAPPPPSSSMPKAYAHPPVSPATERDAAAEASSDTRGVLKVRASSRPHPARSLARHASVGKEKPSVRRPSLGRRESDESSQPLVSRMMKTRLARAVAPPQNRSSTRRSRAATWGS